MCWLLTTPTVEETPAGWDRLFIRVNMVRGVTIVQRWDGTFYDTRYPAQTELEEVRRFWLGGTQSLIGDETRDELVAAGYGDYITPYIWPGAYGTVPYGQGLYGGGADASCPA